MKTAISVPDPVFRAADRLARRMHVSRSQLYSTAVSRFVNEHAGQDVTSRLNDVYAGDAEQQSLLPDDVSAMQNSSVGSEEW